MRLGYSNTINLSWSQPIFWDNVPYFSILLWDLEHSQKNRSVMITRLISYFSVKPHNLLLTDALGALVTALSWLIWMWFFKEFFQFNQLYLLGLFGLATGLFCLSLSGYLIRISNVPRYLRLVIFGNISFLLFLLGLLVYFWTSISLLPRIYMFSELLVVSGLIYIEIQVKHILK